MHGDNCFYQNILWNPTFKIWIQRRCIKASNDFSSKHHDLHSFSSCFANMEMSFFRVKGESIIRRKELHGKNCRKKHLLKRQVDNHLNQNNIALQSIYWEVPLKNPADVRIQSPEDYPIFHNNRLSVKWWEKNPSLLSIKMHIQHISIKS